MDFEDWLRQQLAKPGHPESGPAAGAGRRRRLAPPIISALQLVGIGVAIGAVVFGATLQFGLTNVQLRTLASAPSLPANTWAGSPPPPALDSTPGSDDHPEAVSTAPPTAPAETHSTGRPTPAAPSGEDQHQPGGGPTPSPSPAPGVGSGSGVFTLVGGSATVGCTAGNPSVTAAASNPGFVVERDSGGGGTVEVRFRSASHESKLDASCSGNAVQGRIEEAAR